MKTIPEIQAMQNKAVVDLFEGHVKTVFNAQEPTGPQKQAGIHRQTIMVRTAAGEIGVSLMKKHLHVDKSVIGQKFRFGSTKNDKGELKGVVVSKWEKKKETITGLDVWGDATMYAVDESKEQADGAAPQNDQPKGAGDPLKGVDNYIKLHKAIFDIVSRRYEGSGVSADAHKETATHYLIGCSDSKIQQLVTDLVKHDNQSAPKSNMPIEKESLVKAAKDTFDASEVEQKEEPAAQQDAELEKKQEPAAETKEKEQKPIEKDWKKVTYKGAVISQMDKNALIDVCLKVLPHHSTDNPAIKSVLRAAMKSKVAMELSYEEIYDAYDVTLQNDHDKPAIDTSYDSLRKKGKSDDELCKEILFEQETFIEIIKSHENQ